jgi:hypothetical protein
MLIEDVKKHSSNEEALAAGNAMGRIGEKRSVKKGGAATRK